MGRRHRGRQPPTALRTRHPPSSSCHHPRLRVRSQNRSPAPAGFLPKEQPGDNPHLTTKQTICSPAEIHQAQYQNRPILINRLLALWPSSAGIGGNGNTMCSLEGLSGRDRQCYRRSRQASRANLLHSLTKFPAQSTIHPGLKKSLKRTQLPAPVLTERLLRKGRTYPSCRHQERQAAPGTPPFPFLLQSCRVDGA